MRTLLALAFLFALCSCGDSARCGTGVFDPSSGTCTCPEAADPASSCVLPRDHFDAEAHRGARATFAPGNTLPAFIEAIRVGADTLEGDMQVTSDGAVVLNHDDTLSAECVWAGAGAAPASRAVVDLTASEVAQFDCHPSIAGIDAPPRLEAVLDLRTRANVRFDLELKVTTTPEVDTAMLALVAYDAACAHCLSGRLIVQSFDEAALRQARTSYGDAFDFEISYLAALGLDDPASVSTFADIYAPNFGSVTSDFVTQFHAAGLRVLPWTVDDEPTMCSLMELGVDGIISDDPALLVRTATTCR